MKSAVEERGDGIRSVVVFPEGTRSRSGKLQEFKKGAFLAAVEYGRPAVPIFINGTWESLPPHRKLLWPRPANVVVFIGDPIETTHKSREELENDVREWMENIVNAPA